MPRRSGFPGARLVRTGLALQPAMCSSHFLVMCLVHMNNKAAGSGWPGLHSRLCACGARASAEQQQLLIRDGQEMLLNIMKTKIRVYPFHYAFCSSHCIVSFKYSTSLFATDFSISHTFRCKTRICMRAHLHTRSICLLLLSSFSPLCISLPLLIPLRQVSYRRYSR